MRHLKLASFVLAIGVFLSGGLSAQETAPKDPKAAKLRALFEKFSGSVVTLTWSRTSSGRGQSVESTSSTTGSTYSTQGGFNSRQKLVAGKWFCYVVIRPTP